MAGWAFSNNLSERVTISPYHYSPFLLSVVIRIRLVDRDQKGEAKHFKMLSENKGDRTLTPLSLKELDARLRKVEQIVLDPRK